MAGATDVGVTDPDHHGVRWVEQGLQPCTCRGIQATATATATAEAAFRGLAGRCRSAGTLQVRPCKLGSRIHAADTPHSRHRPTSDRFRRLLVGVDLGRHGRSTPCVDALCSILEIFDSDGDSSTHSVDLRQIVDQGRHLPAARICRRRGGSGCGGVRGMDAAAKPPWTGLRRLPQPDPPRHPTDCPLLTLTLTLTLIQRVQGCKPCR